jgi:Uma2 family endonuclease
MAQPASDLLLDHVGPWTEAEFLALPEDRRIELLDGELLVSPSARRAHQRLSSRLWSALDAAATPGHEVLEAINVRVGPGRILIPDLAVVTDTGADDVVADAAAVALVVEIASPGSVAADRAIKPALYAAAGIPGYVRVDLGGDGVGAAVYRLAGGRYVVSARVPSGERLSLTEPFPVELDLVRLAVTTRGHS